MKDQKDILRSAHNLVSTSVDDLISSMSYYSYLNRSDIATIKAALAICQRRKEKTKVLILQRKLRKMYAQYQDAKKLFAEAKAGMNEPG